MNLLKMEMMIMNHQINNQTNQIEYMRTGHKYRDIEKFDGLSFNQKYLYFHEFCDDLEELCINQILKRDRLEKDEELVDIPTIHGTTRR